MEKSPSFTAKTVKSGIFGSHLNSIAYVGIGSNLSNPIQQVLRAILALTALEVNGQFKVSSVYHSLPLNGLPQPTYVNAVVRLAVSLSPFQLLDKLQQIEVSQGRVRSGTRHESRPLDLDLLLFDQQVLNTPKLQLPHPGLLERDFVLYPLKEILKDQASFLDLKTACTRVPNRLRKVPKQALLKAIPKDIDPKILLGLVF